MLIPSLGGHGHDHYPECFEMECIMSMRLKLKYARASLKSDHTGPFRFLLS